MPHLTLINSWPSDSKALGCHLFRALVSRSYSLNPVLERQSREHLFCASFPPGHTCTMWPLGTRSVACRVWPHVSLGCMLLNPLRDTPASWWRCGCLQQLESVLSECREVDLHLFGSVLSECGELGLQQAATVSLRPVLEFS